MTRVLLEWRGSAITETLRPDGTVKYVGRPRVRGYRSLCCLMPGCDCPTPEFVLEVPVIDHRGQLMDRGE